MNTRILIALMFLAAPATAKADLVFKCKSAIFSDQLSADLRFAEDGKSGRLELDYWNGYPPIGLVYADLSSPQAQNGKVVFPPATDSHSGYSAELSVPSGFVSLDDFKAAVVLNNKRSIKKYELNCNRF